LQAVSATREPARTRPPGPKLFFGEGADGPDRETSAWRHGRQGRLPRFGVDGAVRHGLAGVGPGAPGAADAVPPARSVPVRGRTSAIVFDLSTILRWFTPASSWGKWRLFCFSISLRFCDGLPQLRAGVSGVCFVFQSPYDFWCLPQTPRLG